MKLLLYGVNYAPELTGIGKYSGEMAEWLVKQGHEVRVVTAPPYYPAWKVSDDYSAFGYSREMINGVEVFRCPLYVPNRPSGLKRIVHLASFALSTIPVLLKQLLWRPDVVMVIEPPIFCAPMAWLASRLSGGKSWLHVQDFEVDMAFDLRIIRSQFMKSTISAMERQLMLRFDVVSTISESMIDKLKEKGVSEPVLFPNWADFSSIQYTQAGRERFRAELGLSAEQCFCLYSGNIAVKQGLEIVLDVAGKLPGFYFAICGDGAAKRDLQQKAEEMHLKNLRFLPLQPLENLSSMLSAADIHLVIQKSGAADLVLPSKLTNILAVAGVAVVTAEVKTELGLLGIGEKACVYRCEPESPEQLADALTLLSQDDVQRKLLGQKARSYAEEHMKMERVLNRLELGLKEVIS